MWKTELYELESWNHHENYCPIKLKVVLSVENYPTLIQFMLVLVYFDVCFLLMYSDPFAVPMFCVFSTNGNFKLTFQNQCCCCFFVFGFRIMNFIKTGIPQPSINYSTHDHLRTTFILWFTILVREWWTSSSNLLFNTPSELLLYIWCTNANCPIHATC